MSANGWTYRVGLCFLMVMATYADETTVNTSVYCSDLNSQNNLDIDQLMGMWYGSEVYTHADRYPSDVTYESCIVIHLANSTNQMTTPPPREPSRRSDYYDSDPRRTQQPKYKYLRLIWDERGATVEYSLKYNNSHSGFWMVTSPQSGTLAEQPNNNYDQFVGNIQVMKAVSDHMVLTFCHSINQSQVFSVVLTRHPNSLTSEDNQGIKNLLKHRGLSTQSVRKVCRNGANEMWLALPSILAMIGAYVFTIL